MGYFWVKWPVHLVYPSRAEGKSVVHIPEAVVGCGIWPSTSGRAIVSNVPQIYLKIEIAWYFHVYITCLL